VCGASGRRLRRRLAETMLAERPSYTGRQLLDFKSIISGVEADLQQYERALQGYAHAKAGDPVTHHATRITVQRN